MEEILGRESVSRPERVGKEKGGFLDIPLSTRLDNLDKLQLLQIIATNCAHRCHKEDGLRGMECRSLRDTVEFPEWYLRQVF